MLPPSSSCWHHVYFTVRYAGAVDRAMEMFSDLRQFDEAKKWAEEFAASGRGDQRSVQELINRQAEWSEEVKNYDAAAEMYIKVGPRGVGWRCT